MGLFGPAKQELIIESEDVVSDDDIGVFALDERGPSQQDFALGGDAVAPHDGDGFDDGAFDGLASVENDAVIQIRLGGTVFHKSGPNHGDGVAF